MSRWHRLLRSWLSWAVALTALTALLVVARGTLDKAHIALALLLLVLFGAAAAGRLVGLGLAMVTFLVFNWFFLAPYGTFTVRDPRDWLVLAAFLATAAVAAQLLARAQERTLDALARAAEVDRLATLGAETLNVARPEEALDAIAAVIREATSVDRCEILARANGDFTTLGASGGAAPHPGDGAPGSLVASVGRSGQAALERTDGTARQLEGARVGPELVAELAKGTVRAVLLPLVVRGRTVGVLRLDAPDSLHLDVEQRRFVDALSYYAALGVERVHLASEAAHALALQEADRLKDALIASVSHDLRTPLTAIKALAHDLRNLGDERVELIEQAADRLNHLVADLLDLSRLDAGGLTMRVEVNAVDDLLGAVLQQVEPVIGADRIVVALPPDDPLVLGAFDFVQTLRIVGNLLENAAKYTPGASPIEVRVHRREGGVAIIVADRGPGVRAEDAARIFEPFYRPPGAAPDTGGTGLGLSIARRLAEAEGGQLTYAPRPGGGSEFTLLLPAADQEEAGAPS